MSLSEFISTPMPHATTRRVGKPSALNAAIAAYREAGEHFCNFQEAADVVEAKVKAARPALPGVFCSMIPETTIITNGEATTFPERPCFFRSIDEIEDSNSLTEDKRAEKRTEMLKQIAQADAAVPAELMASLHTAKRDAEAASLAFDKAEAAVANFKPTTAAEAAELLEIVANPRVNTFNERQERAILKRIATALRNGGLR